MRYFTLSITILTLIFVEAKVLSGASRNDAALTWVYLGILCFVFIYSSYKIGKENGLGICQRPERGIYKIITRTKVDSLGEILFLSRYKIKAEYRNEQGAITVIEQTSAPIRCYKTEVATEFGAYIKYGGESYLFWTKFPKEGRLEVHVPEEKEKNS
jgi:hypothetical protein